ncbi:MAG: hypothetical protein ACM4D3_02035 [Candidatus Sericytochromatia bacterium]
MATKKGPLGSDVTLVSVAEGDRLEQLKRMARRVGEEIDTTGDARALVLLTGRLADLLEQIDELDTEGQTCAADQIAARRARRRSS